MSGGAQVMWTSFSPSSAWSTTCSATFTPPSDDNNLQIRVSTGDPVLVDNIAITAM